jgi:hypothetical protein
MIGRASAISSALPIVNRSSSVLSGSLHYAGERVYDIYDAEKKDTEATFEATRKVLKD